MFIAEGRRRNYIELNCSLIRRRHFLVRARDWFDHETRSRHFLVWRQFSRDRDFLSWDNENGKRNGHVSGGCLLFGSLDLWIFVVICRFWRGKRDHSRSLKEDHSANRTEPFGARQQAITSIWALPLVRVRAPQLAPPLNLSSTFSPISSPTISPPPWVRDIFVLCDQRGGIIVGRPSRLPPGLE